MIQKNLRNWLVAALLVATPACSNGDGGADATSDAATVDFVLDFSAPQSKWSTEVIATGELGNHIKLQITSAGRASMAYFATQGVVGEECTELGPSSPPKVRFDLYYAEEDGSGGWSIETISQILIRGQPAGLDYKTAPDGTPTVSTPTGEPVAQIEYCSANNVGVFSRVGPGNWSLSEPVTESGEAATGMADSDFGSVVGLWPGLNFDNNGNVAVVYQDVHAGGLQFDDARAADVEMYWEGFGAIPVDPNRGAGDYNRLIFDSQNRPVLVYHNPTDDFVFGSHGLWAGRSDDNGANWDLVQVNIGKNFEPSLVLDPDGQTIWVAYYKISDGLPFLAKLTDPTQFTDLSAGWEITEFGDHLYNEGQGPSLAFGPGGLMAVAYYPCSRATNTAGCSPGDDAVVFAWLEDGEWEREVVDEGDEGLCGQNPSLGFKPDGTAVIAYQCAVSDGAGGFTFEVRVATREPLN